jgi:hypothetical protein
MADNELRRQFSEIYQRLGFVLYPSAVNPSVLAVPSLKFPLANVRR